jgi:hypothetical protein
MDTTTAALIFIYAMGVITGLLINQGKGNGVTITQTYNESEPAVNISTMPGIEISDTDWPDSLNIDNTKGTDNK